jgi:methyl-accepting chemotaxis protein
MTSWTISRRIVAGFSAMILIVALLIGSFEYFTRQLDYQVRTITQDNIPGLLTSSQALHDALNYRVLTLRHLVSRDPAEWASIEAECDALAKRTAENLARYEKTVFMPEDRAVFEKVGPAFNRYRDVARQMRQLNASGDHIAAAALVKSAAAPAFAAYEQAVLELTSFNESYALESSEEIAGAIRQVRTVDLSLAAGSIVFAAGAAFWMTRRINRAIGEVAAALTETSTQVASAAGQVSAASQSLARGSSEQASSLEETSASLEEMASMTKRNAESARQANDLSTATRASADRGATHMGEMRRAMDAIKASSHDIAKIIKTIDEIAFQTNILALNAAVEAARAGEAGAGFAVVADEVRSLAQRSAQSAKETANKIEDAIRKSENGVAISGSVADALSDIVEKAREVDALVAEIAEASKEQSQGIDQLNSAVSQMDRVTQSNASNAEETASAAEELTAQAGAMRDAVEDLETLLHGASRMPAASATRSAPRSSSSRSDPIAAGPGASKGAPQHLPVRRDEGIATVATVGVNSHTIPLN